MAIRQYFKILFRDQNEVLELHAAHIFQSELYGFIEVEELILGMGNDIVVNPKKEKVREMFSHVHRSFIPLNAILRIDEIEFSENTGDNKHENSNGNVTRFPVRKILTPTPTS